MHEDHSERESSRALKYLSCKGFQLERPFNHTRRSHRESRRPIDAVAILLSERERDREPSIAPQRRRRSCTTNEAAAINLKIVFVRERVAGRYRSERS